MSRKVDSASSPMTLVPSTKKEVSAQVATSLHHQRSAVAVSEHEAARLTGMTRSLDRRLLALNLQPFPPSGSAGFMKVA